MKKSFGNFFVLIVWLRRCCDSLETLEAVSLSGNCCFSLGLQERYIERGESGGFFESFSPE